MADRQKQERSAAATGRTETETETKEKKQTQRDTQPTLARERPEQRLPEKRITAEERAMAVDV